LLKEHINSLSNFVLILEYNGKRYFGFQWQEGQPTIQATLEEAIKKVTGQELRILAASRTDTGVHATYQVVSFRVDTRLSAKTLVKAINHYLPEDIAVKSAGEVSPYFNVQKNAISREYEYKLLNSPIRSPLLQDFVYQVPYRLDIDRMNQACRVLEGEHDFKSFVASSSRLKNTVRNVYKAEFRREKELIIFYIKANSFLTHQVRNTMGVMLRIGTGKIDIEQLKLIMAERRYGAAGPAVPAKGLCLIKVNYPRELELKYENLFN
jgi:tRNA pseudouridine38-40 synthase